MIPKDLTEIFSSKRFSPRLLLGTLIINLFMVMLVGSVIYQSRLQYESHAGNMTEGLAHILEESFTGMVQKIDVSMLAVSDEVTEQWSSAGRIDAASINAFMARRLQRLPEIDSLRIADKNGIVRYGSGVPVTTKVDISDRKHFTFLKEYNDGRLFIGEPIFARINKKWVLPIARRLNHPDGSFAGIVYAFISLDMLKESFSHLDTGPHGVVNLRDAEMNMIVRHPEPQGVESSIGKNTLSPPLKALLDAGLEYGTYKVYGILDHLERTYSYRKIKDLPLYITVGFAADDYLAEWRKFSTMLGAVAALFILLTSVSAWVIYRGELRRSQAVKALQILNRDFLTLLESTTDFIYFKDKDSRIRFCSQTMARITGHSSWREMVGKHDLEIFPEETARIYYEEELPLFRDGVAILNRIDPYFDEQGQQGWVSTNKWPVFAEDGKTVVGIFGISRDITDYKRAELALRESEQRFRNMFHKHSSIMLLIDPESGLVVDANSAAAAYYGYSEDELRGMPIGKINTLSEEEIRKERILATEEKRNHFVFTHRLASGEIRTVEVYSSPVAEGDRQLLFSIVYDITERKQAERKLVESEARLRTIIQNEPECIKIVDEQGILTQMNPAGLAMIEAESLEQVAGRPVLGVIAPEYRDAFAAMHKRVIAGETMKLEFEVLGLNGGRRWLETHAVPLVDNGKVVHLAVTRDITDRKKSEQALKRSNADLERFAYSVSHDMRQPLRAVSGHLQLLQRSMKDKLDEDERENMAFALEGARRMDSMIVSLLDYSRVGRKTESKQWMSSRVSLDEAVGFLEAVIGETKAEVVSRGDWPQVFASRDELTRLFQNLIGNAIKFRDPGQSARIEIDSSVQGETWRVAVRDHGVGIDPQQIDRLFQFFSRLQSRSRFEGTGMGLALCRRIVEHHDGRIWAESEGEGKGSVFIFELPLKGKEQTS